MADEPSVEATVAGEAASAAVEEVHAREEVVETAQEAALEAAVATDAAIQAEESAGIAVDVASDAHSAAMQASGEAQQAQEAIASVGYATADAMAAMEERNEQRMREMREYIDSRIPLPTQQPETNQVEEVEVSGGTGNSNSGGGAESAEGSSPEEGASQKSPRYGLRHKRRR